MEIVGTGGCKARRGKHSSVLVSSQAHDFLGVRVEDVGFAHEEVDIEIFGDLRRAVTHQLGKSRTGEGKRRDQLRVDEPAVVLDVRREEVVAAKEPFDPDLRSKAERRRANPRQSTNSKWTGKILGRQIYVVAKVIMDTWLRVIVSRSERETRERATSVPLNTNAAL
jgi:hypothetical protein